MIGHRIAAQTQCFAQSLKQALHTAARLECEGVQIDARQELTPSELSETGLRQLRKLLNDLNLRVSSVAFPTRRGYANPADLQPRIEATKAAMLLASRLDARVLIAQLGPLPDEEDANSRATLLDSLSSLSSYGNHVGVHLTVQTATPVRPLVDWLTTLPSGLLWLDLHPARLIAQGESPAEYIREAGAYIAHVHATDGVYDLATGQATEVELGRGTAEFPELLGLLEEFSYRDWFTIERRSGKHPIEDMGNAVKYLRAL